MAANDQSGAAHEPQPVGPGVSHPIVVKYERSGRARVIRDEEIKTVISAVENGMTDDHILGCAGNADRNQEAGTTRALRSRISI